MLDVFVAQQPARLALELHERRELVELVDLERMHGAVFVLGHEQQVEYANDLVVDQLRDSRRELAVEFVTGKGADQILDRTEGHCGLLP